jgi:hypothetical protein
MTGMTHSTVCPFIRVPAIGLASALAVACGTGSGRGGTPPSCPEPVIVDVAIDGDTTWSDVVPIRGCFDYVVTTNLRLSQTLTVEPGVEVGFEADRSIAVLREGALRAEGEEEDPIRFAGTVAERGHWRGIAFDRTRSSDNRLRHVTIEHAGSSAWTDGRAANVALDHGARISLEHARVRESAGFGLMLNVADEAGLLDVAFEANARGPASVFASSFHNLTSDNRYGQNDVDIVEMRPNRVNDPAVWSAIDVPVAVRGAAAPIRIRSEVELEAGLELVFAEGGDLRVGNDGLLRAEGTSTEPVVFTAAQPEPGSWEGLTVANGEAQLRNVLIEYGGRSVQDRARANIQLLTKGSPVTRARLEGVVSRLGAGYGLRVDRGVELDDRGSNAFIENGGGSVRVDASLAHELMNTSAYSGNGRDVVDVVPGPIRTEATWHHLGVDFVVLALESSLLGLAVDGGNLKIEPGVTVRFSEGLSLHVSNGGHLEAVGTATEPVRLEAEGAAWGGVVLRWGTASFDAYEINDAGSPAHLVHEGREVGGAVTILHGGLGHASRVTPGHGEGNGNAHGYVIDQGDAYAPLMPACLTLGPLYQVTDKGGVKCDDPD